MSKIGENELKKLKHRDVERVRHHKLQKLINRMADILPGDNKSATQCAILGKVGAYIGFLIQECDRISAIIQVDSSQGTNSSQGPLLIDESATSNSSQDELECKVDPDYIDENKGFPPLPSSLLTPDTEFCEHQQPQYQQHQWSSFDFVNHSPYPSPPATSPPPSQQFNFSQPLPSQYFKPLTFQPPEPHPYQPHCPSCCCYNSPNFNPDNKPSKSFVSRDHLLTETLHDPFINEPNLIWA